MSRETIEPLLREVMGLTLYESRVFLLLALRGVARVSEIPRETGVPRTKVYQVVKSLYKRGFIDIVSRRPLVVSLRDPRPLVLGAVEDKCRALREAGEALVRALERAVSLDARGPGDLASIRVYTDMESFIESLSRDLRGARENILVVVSRTPIEFDWRRVLVPLIEALARGSSLTYVTPPGTRGSVIMRSLVREALCRGVVPGELGEALGQALSVHAGVDLREAVKRIELYETGSETPYIVIDYRVSYILFTDPNTNSLLFATRYTSERLAKTLRDYARLLISSRAAVNIVSEISRYCGDPVS